MAVRAQDVHPAVVHFPIALLPLAIGADLLGRLTRRRSLGETGRHLMPVAALTAAVSALTGLMAQTGVDVEDRPRRTLARHRNMNVALAGLTTAMAAWRWRRRVPTPAYLALGLAGIGMLSYSSYLGATMVYRYGMGVDPAPGIATRVAPPAAPVASRSEPQSAERTSTHGRLRR